MNWIALFTLIRREVHRSLRLYKQTILPPMLTATLYILIFGFSVGSRIGEMGGFSYLQFILPGLIMMGVITSSYMSVVSSLFLSKFQGNIQEILVSPMSYLEMVLGYISGGVARGLIVGLGITLVSAIFANIPVVNPLVSISFAFIISILFSSLGYITALWAKNFDQMGMFSTFLITPLIYVGGVFYSIDLLPPLFQSLSKINPILYMVNGFRYGFLGVSDVNILFSSALIIILAFLSILLCINLTKKGWNLRA
ncbi:ABC transporter permease [Candidatus Woesearchaeota archaeon]|nr:MAG: ABC transporter permease [Candidatus Woesearchaeota archaeon]